MKTLLSVGSELGLVSLNEGIDNTPYEAAPNARVGFVTGAKGKRMFAVSIVGRGHDKEAKAAVQAAAAAGGYKSPKYDSGAGMSSSQVNVVVHADISSETMAKMVAAAKAALAKAGHDVEVMESREMAGEPDADETSALVKALEECACEDAEELSEEATELGVFNTTLSKLLMNLKKDVGATMIRQNYKGTGKRAHRRQMIVRMPGDSVIDVWLDNGFAQISGVYTMPGVDASPVEYGDQTPEQIYTVLKGRLQAALAK